MDPYRHGKEMFYLAALTLAKGTGGVKERLYYASNALTGLRITEEIPTGCGQEFAHIWKALTRVQDEKIGNLAATIQQMDDEEASNLAEQIFNLYGKVLHGTSL